MRAMFLLAMLAASLAHDRDVEAGGITLRVLDGRPVVSGVRLDGHGPYTFVLDTGAEANVVAEDLAAKLGWTPAYQVEVATAAGVVLRGVHVAPEVELGPVRAERQEFVIAPLGEIRRLAREIDGVLGQEFLGRFDYLLDLRHERLVFGEPVPAGGVRVPFELSQRRMVARTNHGRLVIDSGANAVILHSAQEVRLNGRARLATHASTTDVRTGSVTLRIGGREYRDVAAAIVPGVRTHAGPDGLAPACLFGSMFVSNSSGYLIVDPDD